MAKDSGNGRRQHFTSKDAVNMIIQGRYKLSKMIRAIQSLEASVPGWHKDR